ncbi:MAG: TonB-dependent receptor [Prevotellaceae bacterium]|jgi:outer membrane receptor protein involved in Fe transport|nr:TonB-dependent receptor [Prevotellaceae bacterium]
MTSSNFFQRTVFSLFVVWFACTSLSATTVFGQFVDSQKNPVTFAGVALLAADSTTVVRAALTDEEGQFIFNDISAGNYIIETSVLGFIPFKKHVSIAASDLRTNLGRFSLKENNVALDAVEITGQASQMRFDIDRKVFNIDQNLAAAGASVSEALENIPSIEVDNEGNISLRNSSSVEVWINGKPAGLNEENRAQILQQMPAGSIESVEIITNPSAKYSPEGTSGVINLVMKKQRQSGYFGSVMGGIVYPYQDKVRGNIGANINYNSSLVDAYANIGFRQRKFSNTSNVERFTFAPNTNQTDTLLWINQSGAGQRTSQGLFTRMGVDFHLNSKNTLGASAMLDFNNSSNSTLYSYDTWDYHTPIAEQTKYERLSENTGHRQSYHLNLDYVHEFDGKGSELRVALAYGNFKMGDDASYTQETQLGRSLAYRQLQNNSSNNQNAEFKTDFIKKFGETMKFESGISLNWQDRSSKSQIWQGLEQLPDSLQDYDDFGYGEWIAAAYVTYGAKLGKFNFQVGTRGEYANISVLSRKAETDAFTAKWKDYFQIYPTAFISYALPNDNELQINYTRRIHRPRGRQLSAYRDVSDSTNISYGNPDLNPEFANALELNYIKSWTEHVLSVSAYYRYTTDIIQRVRFQSPTNSLVMENTFENIAKSQSTGLELVGKNRLWKWLNLTTTVNLYYSQMDEIVYRDMLLQEKNAAFSWNTRLIGNILFPLGFSGQIIGYYSSPRVIAQGNTKASYGVDLGIRKSLFNKKLNINFTVRDVFHTRRWQNITWSDTFWQESNVFPAGPQFSLNITYNFGNMKLKNNQNNRNNGENGDMEDDFSNE